ncbi:insulinase family protein [Puteibacter caeruleilacunae]|nr:insulinase family protein [Puteibacter caeruleilacunae]
MKLKGILFVAMMMLVGVGEASNITIAPLRTFTLDNGLTVVLNEDHSKPEVFGMVVTKAGSKNDPADATGLAHYMEHMLFKGTQELGTTNWEAEKVCQDKIFSLYDRLGQTKDEEERKDIQNQINEQSIAAAQYIIPNEMSAIISNMGGTDLNAGTGTDYTFFHNNFPPGQMEKWLDLYSHRFMKPVFRLFQAELEVVYEEKNLYKDDFISNIVEEFNRHFYKKHPYGQQTIIGTIDHLKNPSLNRMMEFYQNYYVANNMALVLCGDFNSDEVIPMIKEKFGRWKSGDIPAMPEFKEESFNGREQVTVKMSPIKLGLLGFRTPTMGHPDELAMKVATRILSNEDHTGLLNKLVLDGKVMEATVENVPNTDYSAGMFIIVPKLIGQKLEDAESLVLEQIKKLKEGNFDAKLLEAIKLQIYKEQVEMLESNESTAMAICEAFASDQDINKPFQEADHIANIDVEQIQAVAQKYFGDNYLAFYSRMGFPKVEKIEKPGYKPVTANTNANSPYAKYFETIPSKEAQLEQASKVKTHELEGGKGIFYSVKNPKNDVFNLTINFGKGLTHDNMLGVVATAINKAGTDKHTAAELKQAFSQIGCSYSFSVSENYFTLEIEGLDRYYNESLALIDELLHRSELTDETIDGVIQDIKTERKSSISIPDEQAFAVFNYSRYGRKSPQLLQPSSKEIKHIKADQLQSKFNDAISHAVEVHYVGNTENADALYQEQIATSNKTKPALDFVEKTLKDQPQTKILFLHNKKAVQSKIFIYSKMAKYDPFRYASVAGLDTYLGNGFSGLITQEIREYRSLAYSSEAMLITPQLKGHDIAFVGYIGTQADKTVEAIDTYLSLIRDMPKKSERISMIKNYLIHSASSNQPDFRDLSQVQLAWKRQGYNSNPIPQLVKSYEQLQFSDVVEYWEKNLRNKPMVITIVGNKKSIDLKALKKVAKIEFLKLNDVIRK